MLLHKNKKKYSFFLLLLLFSLSLHSSNLPKEEETGNRPQRPTIQSLVTQGLMGYLSQKYNLSNKIVYEIDLAEHLPPELIIEKLPKTIPITQQRVLQFALMFLLPHLGVASLGSVALMGGAHGLGYHFTGTLLGRPYGYIAEKIGRTPTLRTLAYGNPYWLFKYPVALPRWLVKTSIKDSIQSSLYQSMLQSARSFYPTNILRKIRELKNKKALEKTTEKSVGIQTKQQIKESLRDGPRR